MDTAFTVRNVAKWIAKSIIAAKTAEIVAETVADHTRFEEDNIVVHLGSGCVGWFVSDKLQPVTDAVVDRTADFVNEQRSKRSAKKTAKKEEK